MFETMEIDKDMEFIVECKNILSSFHSSLDKLASGNIIDLCKVGTTNLTICNSSTKTSSKQKLFLSPPSKLILISEKETAKNEIKDKYVKLTKKRD